ncbi:amino acid adenylation domain-containing protein [Kitasatospora sp. NPDC051853]|uniref:amino acid adenylation domain-containing protein n=1 Tax=Kitasatospora sp. NPDC051853 TaxID=3364058 RepID=UPI00379BB664
MDADGRTTGTTRTTSFAQRRLWFLDQLRPGSADHLLAMALRIRGALDAEALTGALADVLERHEVLRTEYAEVDGEPVARVAARVAVPLERVDAEGADGVDALVRRELRRPLDLAAAPPLRAVLARLAEDDHLLTVVVHHIAFDFASWNVLTRELAAGYRARTSGTAAELPELAFQYADFAERQEAVPADRAAAGRAYWRSRLAGLGPLELPTDRPRPPVWDGDAGLVRFTLPADLAAEVDRLARSHRATRYMVLLAAFQALLGRYTGRTDLAVGAPVAGRGPAGTRDLIGLFVNTVVLRTDLSGGPGLGGLVERVRNAVLTDLSHADTPFEHVVTELAPERDLARNPLFQVSFLLLDRGTEPPALPGLDVQVVPTDATGTPLDLVMDLLRGPDGGLSGRLQYATALFDRETVEHLAAGYVRLLREALADPAEPLTEVTGRLPLLPAKERRRLLALGRGPARDLPEETFTDLFERQALATSGAVAVASADGALSYAELDDRANRLAHRLRALGVGRGDRVGVHLERGTALVVALLAILKADAAYVPLDPMHPAQRIAYLIADTGAAVVLTDLAHHERLAGTGVRTVLLDRDRAALDAGPAGRPDRAGGPDDLAYVFHTSGSTGMPKGVPVPHRALANFLAAMADRIALRPGEAVLALTTVSFDPSMLELCLPLTTGARVVVADTEEQRDPERMAALTARHRPAVVQATPSVLRMLTETGWAPDPGTLVLSGGEKLHPELACTLAGTGARVWDLYGPTEATIWTSLARHADDGRILDWSALDNTDVRLLDDRLEPVAEDGTGEIFVSGTGLAWGYLGRPAQTAGAFRPDPHSALPGGRLYATGDLGRLRPDGSIEVLGRRDHQVKIRGHRIEPGEIEAALLGLDDVRAAVVHPTPDGAGGRQLTAYLVPRDPARPPAPDELRRLLLQSLPDYLVPAAFVLLDEVPRAVSGKVDRHALPLPEAAAAGPAPADAAPLGPRERAVAEVWQEVLGIPAVGPHDDFFRLGGHSLLATRVSVRLRAALGVDVPVRALFDRPTVALLAAALDGYPRLTGDRPKPALTPRRRAAATR